MQIQGLFAGQNRATSQRHAAIEHRLAACEGQNKALFGAIDVLRAELAKTNERCSLMERLAETAGVHSGGAVGEAARASRLT